VDPWAGETASDNRYVTLDGDDNLPDLLIGRLPANSLNETETILSKIVGYERTLLPNQWTGTAAFVADDPDAAGDFPKLSESVIQIFSSPPVLPQRLYYTPANMTLDQFRQTLHTMWNAGTTIILYAGHASIHQWAVENFLHLNDILNLKNEEKLPILLEMTCFTGSFQVPGYATLDEALLRHPEGGVAAAWGSTGLGISTGHQWLAQGFMRNIFLKDSANLGTATLAGKLNLAEEYPYYNDLIDTFTLLGDPLMQLNWSDFIYLPLIER
jgi:hypothetical protein